MLAPGTNSWHWQSGTLAAMSTVVPTMFETMTTAGYEQVIHCYDRFSGLRSIIVIHDTSLGPALGGVRMQPYPTEHEALRDCMRLAQGMTQKAAAAGVRLGGGKSVIIGDPERDKSEALLRAHGRFIESLGGRYIPGIDIGTDQDDMRTLALEVANVSCVRGDTSPRTALGVLAAIRACAVEAFGSEDLRGASVAVQGAGHVGSALARMLAEAGASLVVADIVEARAQRLADELGATVADARTVAAVSCDVFCPCAGGGVVDDESIGRLRCRVIAGSANNVLEEPRHGVALHEAGILYAPDYFANAGGLIYLEEEMAGHDDATAERRVRGVGTAVAALFARARDEGIAPSVAAERVAAERLGGARAFGPAWLPPDRLLAP
jgi:leucine dehydrogenase